MAAILALNNVCKRFGAVVVADNIDLSLSQGEALGIIGPNGAGKTSLFNMIAGAVAPDAGSIEFQNKTITSLTAAQRCRAGIGRSFQIPQPFGGLSVFENLCVTGYFGAGEDHASAEAPLRGNFAANRLDRQSKRYSRITDIARTQTPGTGARIGRQTETSAA